MRLGRMFGLLSVAAILAFGGLSASATSFGSDVTMNDGWNGTVSADGGAGNPDTTRTDFLGREVREDNETEPGTVHTDPWDLEGTYFNSQTGELSLAGTFNFKGVLHTNNAFYGGGDIFLAVNPTLPGSPPDLQPNGSLGSSFYGYVFDIEYSTDGTNTPLNWTLYAIDGDDTITGASDIDESNPWQFTMNNANTVLDSGAVTLNSYSGAAWTSKFGLGEYAPGDYGNNGDTHWVMGGFDLSYFDLTTQAIFTHYTMRCGNDTLHGYVPIPEPGTYAILALGLAGLAARRKFAKSK